MMCMYSLLSLIFFLRLVRFEGLFPTSVAVDVGVSDQMSNGIVHEDLLHRDKLVASHALRDVALEFARLAQGDDLPLVDDGHAVTEGLCLIHIVCRNQYRCVV